MIDKVILAKIRKCLALGKSSNEHEAAAALAKARALMDEHGLDEGMLDLVEIEESTARAAIGAGMSHACAIPGCERPAKDGQLMCWPHWRRVPKVLNRAIFETYARGPVEAYQSNVAEAIRAIQDKEASEGGGQ